MAEVPYYAIKDIPTKRAIQALINEIAGLRKLVAASGGRVVVKEGGGGGGEGYVLPVAGPDRLGGVKVGANLSITAGGVLNAAGATPYVLPVASADTLGGVKVGSGLTITDGVLNATGGGGGSTVSIVLPAGITGTQIAKITVDGTDYDIIAPSGGSAPVLTSYLEGHGNEWIDTGIYASDTVAIEVAYRPYATNKNNSEMDIFGSRAATYSSTGNTRFQHHFYSNKLCYGYRNTWHDGLCPAVIDKDFIVKMDRSGFYVGDVLLYLNTDATTFTDTRTMWLFNSNNCPTLAFLGRIYYAKIWDDGTLVANFIPAIQNGENGMFNTVDNTFHGNVSGSGAFDIYGVS